MQNEVVKIGNATFLSQIDKSVIKRILNADFDIVDDFSGNRSKLEFDALADVSLVEEGARVVSNADVVSSSIVKIYLAKYKKNSCDWDTVVFYGILDDYQSVVMDKWEFLYSNEQYCAYRIFSYEMPTTLPLDGELPAVAQAPFIKYETFRNVWLRSECKFKYETSLVSFTDSPGTDSWVLTNAGATECLFSYTKSTPYGCDFVVPDVSDIDIAENCACLEIDESSSSSSSSTDILGKSSSSSEQSDSSSSSESSSLNSSSSEQRMSSKNISTLYLRIIGDPFVAAEYVLPLQSASAVPLVWTSSSHRSDTLTSGTITVYMNSSGKFILSVDATVNGSKIVISNAVISNIRNDNFARYTGYLKGLATICSSYITTKYTDENGDQTLNYDCIISHESLKRNNGSPKKISEIIYDYEMAELSIEDDSEKIILYFGKANIEKDTSSDACRAWGLFCLNRIGDGEWSYSNDDQEIKLTKSLGGCWNLYRKYNSSLTGSEEIEMEIDTKTVTSNLIGEYSGFGATCIVPRAIIRGGLQEATINDVCNDKDTAIVFYGSDSCSQNEEYSPYARNLALTIEGGGWGGKQSYVLFPTAISENLSVWNWSSNSNSSYFEYAMLFSHDGILWKLMLFRQTSQLSKSYLFAEFIKENLNAETFAPVFQKIHKSYLSLDGAWGASDATITVTGL